MTFMNQARQAIQKAGGRFTSQRRLIIEMLQESDAHLDAEELYQQAHEHDASISLATVYRTLNTLAEAQLIDQRYISYEHKRKIYEPVGAEEHHHFTCHRCHQVIEFQSDFVDAIKQELASKLGVKVEHVCMCFEGLCPSCQQAARS